MYLGHQLFKSSALLTYAYEVSYKLLNTNGKKLVLSKCWRATSWVSEEFLAAVR